MFLGGREESGIISLANSTLNGGRKGVGGRRGLEEKAGEGRHEVKQR